MSTDSRDRLAPDRRQFLQGLGAGASAAALGSLVGLGACGADRPAERGTGGSGGTGVSGPNDRLRGVVRGIDPGEIPEQYEARRLGGGEGRSESPSPVAAVMESFVVKYVLDTRDKTSNCRSCAWLRAAL